MDTPTAPQRPKAASPAIDYAAVAALNAVAARLPEVGRVDRAHLLRRIRDTETRIRAGRATAQELERLAAECQTMVDRLAWKASHRPAPSWPDELPVCGRREEIAAAIRDNQVVIVAGETGSGKTTQLPKICLDLGYGLSGQIACTQPRRIAAMTVAQRVADELNTDLGGAVGYRIRFDSVAKPETFIAFLTDGLLLSELRSDRMLEKYDCIIVDEAHERTLNIDFLLGCLKEMRTRRPDLRIIVSSATLDVERFSAYFDGAPIIEVSGRTYPVDIRYLPPVTDPAADEEPAVPAHAAAPAEPEGLSEHIGRAMDEIMTEDSKGDILVFLVGERDIREVADYLERRAYPKTVILPLFARLSSADQKRVFLKMSDRKIILATNVAETSITIPGIRYVVDPGTARVKRYNYRTQVELLQTEAISQASANQRAGRAGRVQSGICYRLYSADAFAARKEFTDPEILRSSLADVILRMTAFDLGRVEFFPFVDPPNPRMIHEGYETLQELGAIDHERTLTAIGRHLAHFPLEPRIGRMLLAAADGKALTETLLIAAFLSIQDPRERPMEKQGAADTAHQRYQDESSDFISILNLWKWYNEKIAALPSNSRVRKFCVANFLSYNRMREWADVLRQLEEFADDLELVRNDKPADYETLHKALMAGLLSHLGTLDPEKDRPEFNGAKGKRFAIWPGSGLAKRKCRWVMAAEMVETSRLFARTVARVQPEWIEAIAGSLCQRSYSDPFWDAETEHVRAHEQVTVYGLPIVPRRRVHYGPINPPVARDVFIRGALVEGQLTNPPPCLLHNQALIAEIRDLEHKGRRRDLLVDQEFIFAFYDGRIPGDIYSGKLFDRWRRRAEKRTPEILLMKRADLIVREADGVTPDRFPASLSLEGVEYPLEYHFDPGTPADGVTINVPIGSIQNIAPWQLDWLVPGLLEEKITFLIKNLPKSLRRPFVPVPDTVKACLTFLSPYTEPMYPALARFLHQRSGMRFAWEEFRPDALPPHLQMRIRVIGEGGREMAVNRSLLDLQAQFADAARNIFDRFADNHWQSDDIVAWSFGALPERISIVRNSMTVFGYPALVDRTDSAGLRLFDDRLEAEHEHVRGLRRLFALQAPSEVRYIQKKALARQEHAMQAIRFGGRQQLVDDLILATMDRLFISGKPPVRDDRVFGARVTDYSGHICLVGMEIASLVEVCLSIAHPLSVDLERTRESAFAATRDEIQDHLARLLAPGFIGQTPVEVLPHFPRYLRALALRLERVKYDPYKDRKKASRWMPFLERYCTRAEMNEHRRRRDPELETYRWMLEEYFVSLFAQELGTVGPISEKRLDEQWALTHA